MADSIGRLAYQRPWQTDASRRLVLGLCSPVNFRTQKRPDLRLAAIWRAVVFAARGLTSPITSGGDAQPGSDPHARSTEPVYSDTGIGAVQPGRVAPARRAFGVPPALRFPLPWPRLRHSLSRPAPVLPPPRSGGISSARSWGLCSTTGMTSLRTYRLSAIWAEGWGAAQGGRQGWGALIRPGGRRGRGSRDPSQYPCSRTR